MNRLANLVDRMFCWFCGKLGWEEVSLRDVEVRTELGPSPLSTPSMMA